MCILRTFTILILLSVNLFAQINIQSNLKRQLEVTTEDAANLKLPENRAIVYAKLGNLYWKFDQKRARELFLKSVDELIAAQNAAEKDKKNNRRKSDLLVYGETRQKILENIIYNDADLAFKLFLKSRSTVIKDAFAGISRESSFNTFNGLSSDKLIVQQENMFEQRLGELLADQNPDRAVEILSEILRKNSSSKTIELLRKIHLKDKSAAEELTGEIIQKTLAADFKNDPARFFVATLFLYEAERENAAEKFLKVDSQTLQNLAEKVAVHLISEADRNADFQRTNITPILIKYLPERADELNKKTVPPRGSVGLIFPQNKKADDLLSSNAPAEELLDQADKFPPVFRGQIYVAAIDKIAFAGDVKRAQEIIFKNFSPYQQTEMIANLNFQLSHRAMEKGDFDQAIQYAEKLPEHGRIETYLNIAESIFRKSSGTKSEKAVLLLDAVRTLLPETPSNLQETYQMGQLAAVYALIKPKKGFDLFNRVITKIVQISEADVISKDFRGDSNVSQGEFIINSGFPFSGLSEIQVSLDKLTRIDFDETLKIINKIPRRDMRIALQLQVMKTAS